MSEIVEGLWVCSYIEAMRLFRKDPDAFVINCTVDLPIPHGIRADHCLRIAVDDNGSPESMKIMYDSLVCVVGESNVIANQIAQGRKVIVHCFAGIQRSAAVAAAYLVKTSGLTIDMAVDFIREKRMTAFMGSVNFQESLDAFQKYLST